MPKEIIWSPLSLSDMEAIVDYLFKSWSTDVINHFIDEVDLIVKQLSLHPKTFPLIHSKLKIRKCVISKHNSIYYREYRNKIQILRIYDNRQNPDNLRFK